MYSEIVNGEVLDFNFKKLNEFTYAFSIGHLYIGQIFKRKNRSWSCISNFPNPIYPIHGFNSRLAACEFLLKHWRLINANK